MKRQLFTGLAVAIAMIAPSHAQAGIVNLTVVNGDFETDAAPAAGASGWTVTASNVNSDGFWTTDGAGLSLSDPDDGQGPSAQFLTANHSALSGAAGTATAAAYQDIDLSAYAGVIDTDTVTTDIDFFYNNPDPNDDAVIQVRFVDGLSALIGLVHTSGDLTNTANEAWVAGTFAGGSLAVPTGARTMRITLTAERNSGSSTNVNYDNVTASLTVIPAPAALPAGLAMLGLAAARRRRR